MSEDTDLIPVEAIKTPDGVLHASKEAAEAHLENVKIAPRIRAFVEYSGVKGRAKRTAFDTVMEFLRWNRQGQPSKAPEPAPEAPAAE